MSLFKKFNRKKLRSAQPGEINYSLFDRFIFAHILIGATYRYVGIGFLLMIILAVFWEIIENSCKTYLPFIFPHGTKDTFTNLVGDCLGVVSGWAVVHFFF